MNPQFAVVEWSGSLGWLVGAGSPSADYRATGRETSVSPGVGTFLAAHAFVLKTVLLVEDNPDDVFFMKVACKRSQIPHLFSVVNDGDAAIDYLKGTGGFGDRRNHPLPHLIFLDIKLPTSNGHEVLEWIRSQPAFHTVPVIMLTSSDEPSDIERAYKLGVTSYLMKNANTKEFEAGVRVILKYWLELNTAPSR